MMEPISTAWPEAPAVFAEPWQAHAFALGVSLAEAGYFTWKEWTTALAEEIQSAQRHGDADDGSTYYDHWLTVLERLCAGKGLVTVETMCQHARNGGGRISKRRMGILLNFSKTCN